MPGGSKAGGGLKTKKSAYGAPYKMKGNPMKRNFGIPSPLKDDEWIDTDDGRTINMHQGDPKIKRGEKGHIHSTSYIARYNPTDTTTTKPK